MPDDEMLRILDAPAYWAFCWASGQLMARYLTPVSYTHLTLPTIYSV